MTTDIQDLTDANHERKRKISLRSVQSVVMKNRATYIRESHGLNLCLVWMDSLCRVFKSPFKGDLEGLRVLPPNPPIQFKAYLCRILSKERTVTLKPIEMMPDAS